ncbi:MAG: hypothetical protein IH855_02790 [Bacteroidetes bacterium]|nr:hypothetical protein [Bacteroidota bacterium]
MPRALVLLAIRTSALASLLFFALGAAHTSSAQPQLCADTQVYLMDNVRTNYSMGYENYKNEDWCAALPYLRWVLANDPLYTAAEPDERNYRRLAAIYEGLAGMADDAAVKRTYLDSSFVAREQMFQVMDENGFEYNTHERTLARGRFYETHAAIYPENQPEVYNIYLDAFRMEPDSTDDYYLSYIGRVAAEKAAVEEMDPREARDLVDELIAYSDDPTYLEGVSESFRIEPIEYFADLHVGFRNGALDEEETKVLFVMASHMDSLITAKYPEIDPDALADELLPIIVEFDPSPDLLAAMGGRECARGNIEECTRYIERAIAMSESSTQKRDLWYSLANRMYSRGNRGTAYTLAGNALQYDSNFGPALYLRASVVARSLNRSSIEGRIGAWCVADMFSRAAAAGGPTAANARQQASVYSGAGPSREECFFNDRCPPGTRVTGNTGYGSCTTTAR